jgi:hypothetical protein
MRHDPNDHPLAICACGRKMEPGQYVCQWCTKYGKQLEGWGSFELVAKPRRSVRNQGIGGAGNAGLTQCDLCPPAQFAECRECILEGRVLACEWSSQQDYGRQEWRS